jgi:hypothetical protein
MKNAALLIVKAHGTYSGFKRVKSPGPNLGRKSKGF